MVEVCALLAILAKSQRIEEPLTRTFPTKSSMHIRKLVGHVWPFQLKTIQRLKPDLLGEKPDLYLDSSALWDLHIFTNIQHSSLLMMFSKRTSEDTKRYYLPVQPQCYYHSSKFFQLIWKMYMSYK